MNKYETPNIVILEFEKIDIITRSNILSSTQNNADWSGTDPEKWGW